MKTILVGDVKLPTFEMPQMARDFGLDITVPDGGLVSSAANQKQYKAECGRIYKEFMVTMGDYLQEEEEMKQELRKLQSKKSHIGQDGNNDDALSENISAIFTHGDSRKGGFITRTNRPQTAAGMFGKRFSPPHPPNRPSTVADYAKGMNMTRRQSLPRSQSSAQFSVASTQYDGVMDQKSQYTRDRKLKMNTGAFTKLLAGKVNIKLQHKEGEFVLKQVLDNNRPAARDSGRSMDFKDKIALVRKKTNFKSPTLASDLKINNLVAIQRSLQGLPAKRITVGEIMEKAKDRRARLFKVEVSGSIDNGGIYSTATRYNTNHSGMDMADDISTVPSHDGIRMVKVEARKRTTSSSCAFSQDGQDMRKYKESILKANKHDTPRSVKLNMKRQSFDSASRNVYLDTSAQNGGKCEDSSSDKSECDTPHVVTSRDAKALVKRSQEDDLDREIQLNKWRQRLTFAAVKRNGLGRILSRAGMNVALR